MNPKGSSRKQKTPIQAAKIILTGTVTGAIITATATVTVIDNDQGTASAPTTSPASTSSRPPETAPAPSLADALDNIAIQIEPVVEVIVTLPYNASSTRASVELEPQGSPAQSTCSVKIAPKNAAGSLLAESCQCKTHRFWLRSGKE